MKHFEKLTNKNLQEMKTGEEFTYKIFLNGKVFYKKGMMVMPCGMVPIGLPCETIERARKQN